MGCVETLFVPVMGNDIVELPVEDGSMVVELCMLENVVDC